jgi:hypothetical protein
LGQDDVPRVAFVVVFCKLDFIQIWVQHGGFGFDEWF